MWLHSSLEFPPKDSVGKRWGDPGRHKRSSPPGSQTALNSLRSLRLAVRQTALPQCCWQSAPFSGPPSQGLGRQDRCVENSKRALGKKLFTCQKMLETYCEEQRRNKIKAILSLHGCCLQKPQMPTTIKLLILWSNYVLGVRSVALNSTQNKLMWWLTIIFFQAEVLATVLHWMYALYFSTIWLSFLF